MSTEDCNSWVDFGRVFGRVECDLSLDHIGQHKGHATTAKHSSDNNGQVVLWWQDETTFDRCSFCNGKSQPIHPQSVQQFGEPVCTVCYARSFVKDPTNDR